MVSGAAGVGPAVLINADDPHPVQPRGVSGDDRAGGVQGDGVDGVPRQSEFAGHRRHRGAVDHQSAQDVAGTPPRGRPARACQCRRVVGEHFPLAGRVGAAIPRYPDPQPQRMPDHRHVGDRADHGVPVDTLATAARAAPADTVVEQGAEHHRGLTVNGGVGDRHTELDSPHDRVGNNSSRQRRRVRHRAPRQVGGKA